MVETRIYIGLNDSFTKKQVFKTDTYVALLKDVCCAYRIPFSFELIDGGYIHENGEYTHEKSLVLILIDIDKKIVNEIAKDLCVFFHQESVMITEGHIRSYFISETLE